MNTFEIIAVSGPDELILTDEGFMPYHYEGVAFDTLKDATDELRFLDADWLRMDGFDDPSVWELQIRTLDENSIETVVHRARP